MTSVTEYELLSLIQPDLSDEELNEFLNRLRRVITDAGGEIANEELWGKRRLAYDVRKFREGTYNYTVFQGGPQIPRLIQEFANTEARLLRHLCTVIPKRKILEDERRSRVEAERARREQEEARRAAEAEEARKAAAAKAAAELQAAAAAEEPLIPPEVPGEAAARVVPPAEGEPDEQAGEEEVTREAEGGATVAEGDSDASTASDEEPTASPEEEEDRKETGATE